MLHFHQTRIGSRADESGRGRLQMLFEILEAHVAEHIDAIQQLKRGLSEPLVTRLLPNLRNLRVRMLSREQLTRRAHEAIMKAIAVLALLGFSTILQAADEDPGWIR